MFDRDFWQGDPPMGRYGAILITARAGRKVVGYAIVTPEPGDNAAHECSLDEVGVLDLWRRIGLGRRLVGEAGLQAQVASYTLMAGAALVGKERSLREQWMVSMGFRSAGDWMFIADPAELTRLRDQ